MVKASGSFEVAATNFWNPGLTVLGAKGGVLNCQEQFSAVAGLSPVCSALGCVVSKPSFLTFLAVLYV